MIVSLCELLPSDDIITYASAKKFCTFKAGGIIQYLVCPKTLDSFCQYLCVLNGNGIKYKVVGNMSNILFSDGLNKGVFVTTRYIKEDPRVFGNCITAHAGYPLVALCHKAASLGLSGIEGLCGVPATVGGAVVNNAGAFGNSIADSLQSLLIYSKGKIISVCADYAKLKYRQSVFQTSGEVVLSATLKLHKNLPQEIFQKMEAISELRKAQQPSLPSAGSVFKKTENMSAGYLIDKAGLKGTTIGGAQISTQHANFIVNIGGACSKDIKSLIDLAKNEVKKQFKIDLEREIEYIGEIDETTSRLSYSQHIF